MPTKRRSTRGRAAATNDNSAAEATDNWTGASSPLSSLSTPGSPAEPRDSNAEETFKTPLKRERHSYTEVGDEEDGEEEKEVTRTPVWSRGKRGRPRKNVALLHDSPDVATPGHADEYYGANAPPLGDNEEEVEAEKDAAGEAKIDANGYLQGGREFICPVFRSPFRANQKRQYVLTMDCCRYTGSRDSYMLFKQHPRMRRVETTQEERDLLAEKRMIPKVTRFRPIALITARTAFREFGARLIKNGRYLIDDYWESRCRVEKMYPEGTVVANMGVYHSVEATRAAGMMPGSTRKSQKKPLARASSAQSISGHPQQQQQQQQQLLHQHPSSSAVMVNSWVQLEAQGRQNAPTQPSSALTLANALQKQQQQQQIYPYQRHQQQNHQQQQQQQQQGVPAHMQVLQDVGGLDSDDDDSAGMHTSSAMLYKPMFRAQRSQDTAEAAFERTIGIHRAQAADDHGFVDGAPLVRSMAGSWARATSLSNRLSRQKPQQQQEQGQPDDDGFGPMAYASAKMARELNASIRLWREDNGCTWVDPHTAIRQVPSNLQPTAVCVQRSNAGDCKARVDPRVSFSNESIESRSDDYPLALLPGQFQAAFPVHRTRFGQSCQQAVQSYASQWLRQLSIQQQQQQQQRRPTESSATPRARKK
ncbi:hypothetical protein GGI23_001334 [Coemansia sp. RSA 2559]|nr:hypothetical protein GGI23_001334 [Coemansia sp. RSA 2559]